MTQGEESAAPPGWYADPGAAEVQRWWDGSRWTPTTRVVAPWVLRSPVAGSIARLVAVGAVLASVICLAIALTALAGQRPLDGASGLLVPGVPLLAAGQVLAILVLRSRAPRRSDGRQTATGSRFAGAGMRAVMFQGLTRPAVIVFLVSATACWLLAMTALPWIFQGGPGGSTASCPYVLDDHGVVRCVSQATYLRAGAATQRFACGILGGFFAVHAVVAASLLAVRGSRDEVVTA